MQLMQQLNEAAESSSKWTCQGTEHSLCVLCTPCPKAKITYIIQRTFIHVLKVLVELLLPCFLVVFLLYNMPLVLDVVSDGHPLQTALRVFDCSPGLLDLVIKNIDKKSNPWR